MLRSTAAVIVAAVAFLVASAPNVKAEFWSLTTEYVGSSTCSGSGQAYYVGATLAYDGADSCTNDKCSGSSFTAPDGQSTQVSWEQSCYDDMPGPSGNFIKTTYYNATTCGTNPVMFVYTPATGFCVPNYDEATKTTSYSQASCNADGSYIYLTGCSDSGCSQDCTDESVAQSSCLNINDDGTNYSWEVTCGAATGTGMPTSDIVLNQNDGGYYGNQIYRPYGDSGNDNVNADGTGAAGTLSSTGAPILAAVAAMLAAFVFFVI